MTWRSGFDCIDASNFTKYANTFKHSGNPAFVDYLYKLARRYNAKDIKRLKENKRFSLMLCFLLETRKVLLDHLIKMNDQHILDWPDYRPLNNVDLWQRIDEKKLLESVDDLHIFKRLED